MSRFQLYVRKFRANKSAVFGLAVIAVYVLAALSAGLLFDPALVTKMNLANALQGPCAEHLLGTDAMGRDILVRIVYGSRISLLMGVISTFTGMLIGCFIGASCAYFGGAMDNILMRVLDVFFCIPFLLMAMLIVSVLGSGLQNLVVAITVANIPSFAKLTRGAVLSIADSEYVKAARACGTPSALIIARHILPNAMSVLVVQTAFSVAATMLAASSLSFLGLGVQPPSPEWGAMLADGREYIRTNPHMILVPGIVIALATVSITLVGDGIRDALDPKAEL